MLGILRFLIGFLLIGLVVFFHELGHFLMARLMRVDVDVFSFGMGPTLLSFYGVKTEYRISAFPFGGYCRMKGSADLGKALSEKKNSFGFIELGSYFSSNPIRRFLIYLGGPLMNFLLAVALFAISSLVHVAHPSDEAYVTSTSEYPGVFDFTPQESPIEKGDLVLSVDGIEVEDYQRFTSLLPEDGREVDLIVLRNGKEVDITIKSEMIDGKAYYGISNLKAPVIGHSESPIFRSGDRIVSINGVKTEYTLDVLEYGRRDSNELEVLRDGEVFKFELAGNSFPFSWEGKTVERRSHEGNPIRYGLDKSIECFKSTFEGLSALLVLDFGKLHGMMQGPIFASSGIGNITTLALESGKNDGIRTTFHLLAIVSVSIFALNVLPVPSFDGGQMIISLVELLKKKPLKPKTYVLVEMAGLLVALFIIIGMYSIDILKLFGNIISS